ncbi:MAG: hypothetical protein ACRDOB_10010 [Streptosporangiaceae bacterium]
MTRFGKRGIGGLALAVAGVTALAACSSTNSSGSASPTSNSPGGVREPGSVGVIPAAGTPSGTAGTVTYALQPGAAPNWILPLITAEDNSVYNVYTFEWQSRRPMYFAP